jgi:hypothetical protein
MKRRRCIDSTAHARRRAAHGGAHRWTKEVAARASVGGRQLGRWAKWVGSAEWAGEGFQAKFKDLNKRASDLIFELISRIWSLKSKVSNISNWILN